MQLSERFRRGVVVPLGNDSAELLEAGEIEENSPVLHVQIDDSTFSAVWSTGFFDSVNREVGCIIDDYEEEDVPASMVPSVRNLALAFAGKEVGSARASAFFSALVQACDVALRDGRPLYFVL